MHTLEQMAVRPPDMCVKTVGDSQHCTAFYLVTNTASTNRLCWQTECSHVIVNKSHTGHMGFMQTGNING